MRSAFLLPHGAPCTAGWCPSIAQPDHLNSVSSRVAPFSRQGFTSGAVSTNSCERRRGFGGGNTATFAYQFPSVYVSPIWSHGGFSHSSTTQLLLFGCKVGVSDGGHGRVRICARSSTRERAWQEYEAALQEKDLESALEVLDVLNTFESDVAAVDSSPASAPKSPDGETLSRSPIVDRPQIVDDLTILDTCERTSDLMQVGKVYEWLESRGILPSFGKFKASASDGERLVTEAVLIGSIGLKASEISPKKWGVSGGASIVLPIGIALYSYLVDTGVDLKPAGALVLALGIYDAIYLGGTSLMQVFSMWLPYQRRVLVHEAGHVLIAYLLGCPIRGVILDPMHALKMGIQGQAGTQFWDKTLEMELSQEKLSSTTVDRYSIVLFAGIAAEAFIYGEAQGGENDENLFKSVISQLQPSWSPAKVYIQMSNQARWAVLQAFLLIKENKKAHATVVQALEQGADLGSLVRTIEKAMA